MPKSKYSENLIRLKCSECERVNYYTRKNKKTVEKKINLQKFCSSCRKHVSHKESGKR